MDRGRVAGWKLLGDNPSPVTSQKYVILFFISRLLASRFSNNYVAPTTSSELRIRRIARDSAPGLDRDSHIRFEDCEARRGVNFE